MQGFDAGELALGIRIQPLHRLAHADAGSVQLARRPFLLRDDLRELGLPPFVGLVEVDVRAEEVAREEAVALAAHGVFLHRRRQRRLPQKFGELTVGHARRVGVRGDFGPFAHQMEKGGGRAGGALALLRAPLDLARRDRRPRGDSLPQGFLVAFEGLGDDAEAAVDVVPVDLGFGGHEVEDVANALDGRGYDVDLAAPLAGVDELELQPEALVHRRHGDPIDVVGDREGV